MKKIILILFLSLLMVSSSLSKPYICTQPSKRVEYFEVTIEDYISKEIKIKNFDPREDDTLVVDVQKDLMIPKESRIFKITFVAINSSGRSEPTSFELVVTNFGNEIEYKIEPIPDDNNPNYLSKFVKDNLIVTIKEKEEPTNHGDSSCFISTLFP